MKIFLRFVVAYGALVFIWQPAAAETSEDSFYQGKTISVIVPQGPGGAYDSFARLVSRHLGKHVPGHPTVVARNMPGGNGLVATNYVYNVAPRDGTTLIIIPSTFAIDQLLDVPQIKYDARHFLAVGRLTDTTSTMVFWHEFVIKEAADLRTKPSIVAVSSLNDIFAIRYLLMNQMLGTNIKLLGGYHSARDYALASQRREADGFWIPFITLKQSYADDLAKKRFRVVVQSALARTNELADVPTMLELSDNPKVKQIFRYLVSNDEIGRSLFATPGVPAARLKVLQSAFHRMLDEPDFKDETANRGLPVSPKSGAEIQNVIQDTFDTPPELLNEIRKLMKH